MDSILWEYGNGGFKKRMNPPLPFQVKDLSNVRFLSYGKFVL